MARLRGTSSECANSWDTGDTGATKQFHGDDLLVRSLLDVPLSQSQVSDQLELRRNDDIGFPEAFLVLLILELSKIIFLGITHP